MKSIWTHTTALLVTAGTVVILLSVFLIRDMTMLRWAVCGGAVVAQVGVLLLTRTPLSGSIDEQQHKLEEERSAFEDWKNAQAAAFQQQSARIEERSRDLLEKSARFREFAEYPTADEATTEDSIRLSEHDRKVSELLEKEAERVYEKIRKNGYTSNGAVDIDMIRDEVFDLVRGVAAIYSPSSHNPILETSFEQLARSVSRICLHTLVLLEQLPLDVQKRNINELHSYIRKAVQGYGAYQQVAPWLKHLSRTASGGRSAAGAPPVTLGAWWLATEIGRRGAQKVVENVVDRQAVAVLHDVITVIGVEVANVYGPGYRQRDAGWVYGTELVELLSRFPESRDSLSGGLREITATSLRSEYDRIYLYRCVANHHSAGLRITDPAILARDERESIARKLESFYADHIHGKSPVLQAAWQEDVESRLDLRLKLSTSDTKASSGGTRESLRAIHSFLVSVAGQMPDEAAQAVGDSDLMNNVPLEDRADVLKQFGEASDMRFEPPPLDPSADITSDFLRALFQCVVRCPNCDVHIEELLVETACYFRRSRDESVDMLHRAQLDEVSRRSEKADSLPRIPGPLARSILGEIRPGDVLVSVYTDVQAPAPTLEKLIRGLVIVRSNDNRHRAYVVTAEQTAALWVSDDDVIIRRRKGVFIDDCEVHGGNWSGAVSSGEVIVISGSISGGGFHRYFAPLLAAFGNGNRSSIS